MTRVEIIAGLKNELENQKLEVVDRDKVIASYAAQIDELTWKIIELKEEVLHLEKDNQQLENRLNELEQDDPHLVRSREMYRELTKGMKCQTSQK